MGNHKVPIIYSFFYGLIKKECPRTNFITHRQLMEILRRRLCKLPTTLYLLIIKDLQFYNLIFKYGRTNNLQYELKLKDVPDDLKKVLPYF